MIRVPLLAGTRVAIAQAPDGSVVLRPRAPAEALGDVAAGVRDALRFPLAGPPLAAVAPRGGRATILVEPPALPIPGAPNDPRQEAIAAAAAELERAGVALERQTLLVAGGLARRPGRREVESLVAPGFARRFRGRVAVHDVADEALVHVCDAPAPLHLNRAVAETDVVVVVTAAETVLHGGPGAMVGAADAATARAANAYSLLETSASNGWRLAVALERALARRTPVVGVSLALNHPTLSGAFRGFPYDEEAVERVVRSPLRRLYGAVPPMLRAQVLRSLPSELSTIAVFAGPPSVAHAEALLRAIDARSTALDGQLDAICLPIPSATPHLPREPPNPLLVALLGLGLALRLWRDAFPVVDGGTVILAHPFDRRFAHPTQAPYRAFFAATRFGREPDELAQAERAAAEDERALAEYRAGRTCHPLLPFADWAACQPALGRLGAVLVAGCRDAVAARQLGFVPVRGLGAALEMAAGRAGDSPRLGFVLAPPYFPLSVGDGS